ncbi:MAG: PD40 domain-containing protein [Acidobacteriia bacterium]|nr:PD40 domain-containing protein [Terriglobia bacterium]
MGFRKGAQFASEHSLHRDEVTGATVHQITSQDCINHATYFLQSSFTPDGSTLLFVSYRSGSAQLYEVSPFPAGAIRQLTDGPAIHPFSPAIAPHGQSIFFVRAGAILELNRQTLAERVVVEFAGAQLGECSLGGGGKWLTAAAKRGVESGIVAGQSDGSAWQFIPFPRTVIHPQFHPHDPEWIEFAGDPAPRMHRVRRDGSGLECLYQHGNDEFVVHETFLGLTGDLVYTIWPRALCRMNWKTRSHSLIASCNAWHITPNRAGTQVLCDTNHPDEGLFLVDTATGRRRLICLSGSSNQGSQWRTSRYAVAEDFAAARAEQSLAQRAAEQAPSGASSSEPLSWMEVATDTVYGPQWTHPHPSFSHDERMVVFASDRTGQPQVYVVELDA